MNLTKWLSYTCALFVFILLTLIVGDIFIEGIKGMKLSFLLADPFAGGRKGGIFPIIVSTLLILAVCISVVIPVGLGTAMYLAENKKSQLVKKAIEILASVPSIVFGLFGNALFSTYFEMGFSILSGGLTLALMALPLFVTTVEKGMAQVPLKYKMVSSSLGLSKTTMMKSIILPYALPSIIVGIVLSVGRSLAETAALIFTSGYVDRLPESLLDSGRSLSIHIYDLTMNVPGGNTNAYKTSLVLIGLILLTNSLTNVILKAWHKKRIAL